MYRYVVSKFSRDIRTVILKIKLASHYGFCFGVKRAIDIAQKHRNSTTLGPLIHNQKEIDRLKQNYDIGLYQSLDDVKPNDTIIIRTHGATKDNMHELKTKDINIINATCPYVTTLQHIVKNIDQSIYSTVIFGDKNHPEVKGAKSWAGNLDDIYIVMNTDELNKIKFKKEKIAIVAQTTRNKQNYLDIVNELILKHKEVLVFNTICDATLQNQDATNKLSKQTDILLVVGGKNSSNTKQLYDIGKQNCPDSYLVEDETELRDEWFKDKQLCGITAGASTPNWTIQNIIKNLKDKYE